MSPRAPDGTVIYAIGDIHGRLDLLDELHRRILDDAARRSAQRRLLIYLGDLVSRGPDSRGVIERVRTWLPPGFERVALKGNHEDLLLRAHAGEFAAARHWLDYGGIEALASYGVTVSDKLVREEAGIGELCHRFAAALPAGQLEFLESLRLSHRAGDYYFVHGGVRPGVALDEQNPRDLIWIRKTFLNSEADHGAVVVHGHSISRRPELRPNRIGIDTGAYHSGVLTCLALDGAEQVFLQTEVV
ncbi:MAG: serine/threonine protein phosphatase [Rhodocyclales bacterium]|nr:serine/threonine protein phosphatase [Rhodocyclales bacterium]